jgi:hypoxanthine phosphoribosyltransferase
MIAMPGDLQEQDPCDLPPGFESIHGPAAIAGAVDRLAADITARHGHRELTVVAIMDGALVFAADLLRRLPMTTRLATLRASSYRSGQQSPGKLVLDDHLPEVRGRHVLLVDDIVDTGHTLDRIRAGLLALKPASLEICVLLDKPSRRQVQVPVDWVGLEIPDRFVVGYGLDDDGRHRSLRCIAAALPTASDT